VWLDGGTFHQGEQHIFYNEDGIIIDKSETPWCYCESPNECSGGSNVNAFIQDGFTWRYDSEGLYRAKVKSFDKLYTPQADAADIGSEYVSSGTFPGESFVEHEVDYVIPIEQSIKGKYLPWQGLNIPNKELDDTDIVIDNTSLIDIGYYDIDKRKTLGCFAYGEDQEFDWEDIAFGSLSDGYEQTSTVDGTEFTPDVDVRTPLSLVGSLESTPFKYYDRSLYEKEFDETSSPTEVQFYFYKREHKDSVFEDREIIYFNNFLGSGGSDDTYIAFLDWGDGSPVEHISEPYKLGDGRDYLLNHAYERGGVYDVTGFMFTAKEDPNYLGEYFGEISYDDNFNASVSPAGYACVSGCYTEEPLEPSGYVITRRECCSLIYGGDYINYIAMDPSTERSDACDFDPYVTFDCYSSNAGPQNVNSSKYFTARINIGKTEEEIYIDYESKNNYKKITPIIGGISDTSIFYRSIKRQLGYLSGEDNEVPINLVFSQYQDRLDAEYALAQMDEKFLGDDIMYYTSSVYSGSGIDDYGNLPMDGSEELIHSGSYKNYGEMGDHPGDIDLGYFQFISTGSVSMVEMLGFDKEVIRHVGNPESSSYWKNIIPEDYTIYDRNGVVLQGVTKPWDGDICDDYYCINIFYNGQRWNESYGTIPYYPVLPKISMDGKLNDTFGLQSGSNGEENVPFGSVGRIWNEYDETAPITNIKYQNTDMSIFYNFKSAKDVVEDVSGNQNVGILISDYRIRYEVGTKYPSKSTLVGKSKVARNKKAF